MYTLVGQSMIWLVREYMRMRWAVCVVHMGKRRMLTVFFFLENLKEQDCLVDVCIDWRIILKLALNE
jgi:hypothetical protein